MSKNIIKIKSLTITNFKGIRSYHVDFGDKETNIFGANGSYKSTIVDAFYFLLYGKDRLDRKEFNIKNTVHTELNVLDHIVEGVLEVNGVEQRLKHVYREKWTKRQKEAKKEFTGHEHEYFWNNVPYTKASEYSAKVNEILPENTFKILTNPHYFMDKVKMTERRSILENLAQISSSDIEIAQSIGGFEELIKEISNVSLSELKRKLNADIRNLKEKIELIEPAIKENQIKIPDYTSFLATQSDEVKLALENIQSNDINVIFDAIQNQINILTKDVTGIDDAISDKNKARQLELDNVREVQNKIHGLKSKIQDAEFSIRQEETTKRNDAIRKVSSAKSDIDLLQSQLVSKNNLLKSKQDVNARIESDKQHLRDNWAKQKEREFKYDESQFSCPTCLRDFETDDIKQSKQIMRNNYDAETKRILEETNQKGLSLKSEQEENQKLIVNLESSIKTINSDIEAKNKEIEELEKLVPQNNIDETIEKSISESEDIKGIKNQISDLESEIKEIPEVDVQDLKDRKSALLEKIDAYKEQILRKKTISELNTRIEQLTSQQTAMAQEQTKYEGLLHQANELTKKKITEVESRVNSLFTSVRFKMFNTLINGEEEETCDAYLKDVPWASLNDAGKIQAGLDIIETIGNYYNFVCPIFLDNRESTTSIPYTSSQVINLFVSSADSSLRVE